MHVGEIAQGGWLAMFIQRVSVLQHVSRGYTEAGIGIAIVMGFALATVYRPRANLRRRGVLFAPVALDQNEVNWGRARVYTSPLVIRYEATPGCQAETIIQPKNIQGPLTSSKRVTPNLLVAFCETKRELCKFRFHQIVWAADYRTGDLIEDLFHYLGNAQPGGAPALEYARQTIAISQ